MILYIYGDYMYKNIIFDLDGTLWDSRKQVIDAWKCVFPNINISSVDELNDLMGKTTEDFMNFLFPSFDKDTALDNMTQLEKAEVAYLNVNGANIYTNTINTIKNLSKHHKLFIVSNCQTGYIESFLNYYNLKNNFIDIECNGNTNLSKSKNINLIITRNNLDTNETCYVGDTLSDLNASLDNNIKFIWAKYGFGNNLDCEISIDDISELNNF